MKNEKYDFETIIKDLKEYEKKIDKKSLRIAVELLNKHKSYEKIPRIIRDLYNLNYKNKYDNLVHHYIYYIEYMDLSDKEIQIYDNYNLPQIKVMINGDMDNEFFKNKFGSPQYKINCVKALNYLKNLDFSSFVVGIKKVDREHPLKILNGQIDVLNIIKNYIDDKKEKIVKRNLLDEFNNINIK